MAVLSTPYSAKRKKTFINPQITVSLQPVHGIPFYFGYMYNCPIDTRGSEIPEEELQAWFKMYPLARGWERLGLSLDVANAVAFFASDASVWVTGQVLSVNGGYSMVD